MGERYYFTRHGMQIVQERIRRLEDELQRLQSQVAHVAEVGGNQYHDNASYEMLVIDIRGVDRQLTDAHRCLNKAVVVEPPSTADRVVIGTRVTIRRDGERETWEIVGFEESDPDRKLLAYNTPLASLFVGKCRGDLIGGDIGGKRTEIEVLEISIGGCNEHTK